MQARYLHGGRERLFGRKFRLLIKRRRDTVAASGKYLSMLAGNRTSPHGSIMTECTSLLVFLFFALALIVPSGFSYGAALLVVLSVFLVLKKTSAGLGKHDWLLIGTLAFYFLVGEASNLIHAARPQEYDLPLRFALAIPALLLLRAYPPRAAFFWAGLAIGGIGAGLFVGWQNLVQGELRPGGFTNPIQYGDISILLGTMCFAGLGWASMQSRRSTWIALLIAGGLMGMLGSILTGSRSTWMAVPVLLYIFYSYYFKAVNQRYLAGLALILILIVGALFAIPRTGVAARTEMAVSETLNYFKKGDATTSLGTRIEMWRVGLLVLPERPWLGFGKYGFVERESQLIEQGVVDRTMKDNNHLYNEWLDATVKRGVPGLIAVLALYFLPLFLFVRYLRRGSDSARPYALAGIVLVVNYIGFGLTQAFMTHNIGVMMLGFTLAIVWSLVRRDGEGAASSPR